MAVISTIVAAAGIGLSLYGGYKQSKEAKKIAALQKKQSQQSMAAERARQAQMNLESNRSRRKLIRESIVARATALSAATNQGAQHGSGLQGGLGQIASETAFGVQGVAQGQTLGNQIFDANAEISRLGGQISTREGKIAEAGMISSLGGALVNNAGTIGRVGSFVTGGAVRA